MLSYKNTKIFLTFNPTCITCITIFIENARYSSYVHQSKLANENAITRFLLPCSTKKCNTQMIG